MIKKNWIEILFYICLIIGLIFVGIVFICSFQKGISEKNENQVKHMEMLEGWQYYYNGHEVEQGELQNAKANQEILMKKTLPQNADNLWIYFYPYHQEVKVYVEEELIYEFVLNEDMPFGRSPGFGAQFISLGKRAGKELRVYITAPYDSAASQIPNFYIGQKSDLMFQILGNDISSSVVCFLLLVMGIVLVVGSLVFRNVLRTTGFYHLGLFAIIFSIWSAMQFPYVQILINNRAIVMYLNFVTFELYAIPMILYVRDKFGNQFYKVFNGVACVGMVHFIISVILQITGILDMEDTLFIVHMVMLSGAGLAVFLVMRNLIAKKQIRKRKMAINIGYGLVALCILVDLGRYYVQRSPDIPKCTRVGLIIYVICMGFDYGRMYFRGIESMLEAKVLEKIAYTDMMTHLKNRTAYQEDIDRLNEQLKIADMEIMVVLLDLNNLKQINDLYGHSKGDTYIVRSADAIGKVFQSVGKCYRIGGDEFVVFIIGKQVQECASMVKLLEEYIQEIEREEIFPMSIACGYAEYKAGQDRNLEAVINRADHRMYENKVKMKKQKGLRIGEQCQL